MLKNKGQKFGKLTLTEKITGKDNRSYWVCDCECGNKTTIRADTIKQHKKMSCGKCPKNTWEKTNEYYTGYTQDNRKFYIDEEDFEKISKYTWMMDKLGYISNSELGLLHRFIMKCPSDKVVDHINHKTNDNRKNNLRICTTQENTRNRKSTKGYYWNKIKNKWLVQISLDGKNYHIGYCETEEEARLLREQTEKEYYGEFRNKSK